MSDLQDDAVVRHAASVMTREVDGELVAFEPRAGLAHMLNSSATAIWYAVDGSKPVLAIADELAASVDGDRSVVAADVVATVRHLVDQQLLELVEPSPPLG